jgi:hypothetical protein
MASPAAAPDRGTRNGLATMHTIEISSNESFKAWINAGMSHAHAFALEISAGSSELGARLTRRAGTQALDRVAQQRAARAVTKLVDRAAAHSAAAERDLALAWRKYLQVFAPLIQPDTQRPAFDFQDGGARGGRRRASLQARAAPG